MGGLARSYTPAQIDRGLTILAEQGGNAAAAERVLQAEGERIPKGTLRYWRKVTHIDRYYSITAQLQRASDDRIAQRWREASTKGLDVLDAALDLTSQQIKEGKRNGSSIARDIAVVSAVGVDKTQLLEGRPTQITELRSPDWYDARLAELVGEDDGRYIGDVIDVEAEEIS